MLLLLALVVCPAFASAAEVLVLQSAAYRAYDEAAQALAEHLASRTAPVGPKQVERLSIHRLTLPETGDHRELLQLLRTRKPDLAVAIGSQALAALTETTDVPVVHLLVPEGSAPAPGKRKVIGVSLEVGPQDSLASLLFVAPRVRRVGIVYDPRRTREFVDNARAAARGLGLSLVLRPVRTVGEVPAALEALQGQVDALWMVPDLTVTTRDTVEEFCLFSFRERVPLLTFANRYLERGATVAVTVNPEALGQQAGKVVEELLRDAEGKGPRTVAPDLVTTTTNRVSTQVNEVVAKKLGLTPRAVR